MLRTVAVSCTALYRGMKMNPTKCWVGHPFLKVCNNESELI